MPGWGAFAIALVAVGLTACGKGKDEPKTAEQQRAEREAFTKAREERAMQNPDQVFGKALKGQEAAAKRSADYRKKVDEETLKREQEAAKDEGKTR